MEFAGLSFLAVGLAAVASFIFGSVLYMVLGRPWMAAIGNTEEEIKATTGGAPPVGPMTVAFVSQLVMALVLAGVLGHLGTDQVTAWNGLLSGFFVWLGFVITTLATNHAFQGAARNLTLIDGGHWLGVLLTQGVVIGLMGV